MSDGAWLMVEGPWSICHQPLAISHDRVFHPRRYTPLFIMHGRRLPVLLLLFIGSGCAGLIYEIVWFQLLQLVIGSSAVSLGVLLGTFMGGMCLGSLALARAISTGKHPLRVYAFLELGIAILGITVLFVIPFVA